MFICIVHSYLFMLRQQYSFVSKAVTTIDTLNLTTASGERKNACCRSHATAHADDSSKLRDTKNNTSGR